LAIKKVYAVIAIAIVAVAAVGFYFFILPPPYRVAEREGTIGRSGGCVYDGSANVTIPEGALDSDTKITVKTLNETMLPTSPPPFTELLGATSFGPDGLRFKTNVTITIPLNESKTAGTLLPLFVYNASSGVFIETDVMATVNPSGRTASTNITHFSTVGLFDGLTEAGLDEEITSSIEAGADEIESLEGVEEWIKTELGITICKKVVYEWIGKCYHVSGMVFTFDYEVVGGPPSPPLEPVSLGDVTTWDEWEEYEVQGLVATVHDGVEKEVTYILDLTIYLKYCTPEVVVWASDYQLEVGESATVWAEVRCGEHVLRLREINVYLSGPGTLDKTGFDSTGSSGRHTNTYHATEEGVAIITVQHYDPDTKKTVSGSATIGVGVKYRLHIDGSDSESQVDIYGHTWTYVYQLVLDLYASDFSGNWTGTVAERCDIYRDGELLPGGWVEHPWNYPLFPEGQTEGSLIGEVAGVLTGYSWSLEGMAVTWNVHVGEFTWTFHGVIESVQE